MRPAPPPRQRAAVSGEAGRAPPRLFVEAPLEAGGTVTLTPPQTHYLLSVMRRRGGDALLLFNGRDGEWAAEIEADARGRRCAARLVAQRRGQADGPDLWLLFAPVKRSPIDLVARMATELGASALWPVFTRRTAAARVNLGRLRAIAIEAAEQCGRLTLPDLRDPASLDQTIAGWPDGRRLVVADESGAGAPAAAALKGLAGPAAILVGPEGGFAPEERAALAALPGAVRLALGPRILRAETAAAAALACWQALAGDWRG